MKSEIIAWNISRELRPRTPGPKIKIRERSLLMSISDNSNCQELLHLNIFDVMTDMDFLPCFAFGVYRCQESEIDGFRSWSFSETRINRSICHEIWGTESMFIDIYLFITHKCFFSLCLFNAKQFTLHVGTAWSSELNKILLSVVGYTA